MIQELFQSILSSPLTQAVGWTLVHSLWQILVVALVLRLLLRFFRREAPAFRYAMSLSALFVLCFWSGLTFYQSYNSTPILEFSNTMELDASRLTPDLMSGEVESSWFFGGSLWIAEVKTYVEGFRTWLPYAVVGWLIGICLLGLRLFGGLVYLRHLRRKAISLPDEYLQGRLHKLAGQMGIRSGLRIMESIHISEPITLGFLKPVILFPVGMATGLSPRQVEAVIIHELAHIRRSDYLVNLFQSLVETLFFYHPGIWWINQQIRTEREQSCDDMVVSLCGDPVSYAEALIRLQSMSHFQQPQFVMTAIGNKRAFTARIKRLFHPQAGVATSAKSWSVTLLMVSLLVIFSTALLSGQSAKTQESGSTQVTATSPSTTGSATAETPATGTAVSAGGAGTSATAIGGSGTAARATTGSGSNVSGSASAGTSSSQGNPIVIEITPEMTQKQLNLLVEKLASKGITMKIENKNFNDGKLTSIRGLISRKSTFHSFNAENLKHIRISLSRDPDGASSVEIENY